MKKSFLIISICSMIFNHTVAQKGYKSWDVFRYSGPGLQMLGTMSVKHSKEIKASPWSVGCETLDRDYADFNKYNNYVGELGVTSARLQSGWAKCEKVPGEYSFEWLDTCVYGLLEQSVQPWITLCYGNPIYNSGKNLKAKIFTDDKTMKAWLAYVEATVTRYKDDVFEWEVWNEANNGNKDPDVYTKLLIKTAEVIRKVQPDSKIIGLGMYLIPLDYTEKVLEVLKAENKLDLIDFVSYHPYTYNPDNSYKDVQKLKDLIDHYDPRIKLFQGENGCPSILEWGHALRDYPWTEISQAKWLMRRMAGDRVRDIRTNIFTITDLKYPNMLQSFGLLRANLLHDIIYKRPSYYGVQHMVSFFDNEVKPIGVMEYRVKTHFYGQDKQNITVAGFAKNNTSVALLWYNHDIPGNEMRWNIEDITIEGMNFKEPVYVEMISGKVYSIPNSDWTNEGGNVRFRNLPVWDSVIMLAEKSEVNLK